MHSFYYPGKITGKTATISDVGQLHHLRDVLRLNVGDEVDVFDSEGNEYSCMIEKLDKKQVALVIKAHKAAPDRKLKLTIACAVPKQSRMDEVIDKLTQLGVDSIIPLMTQRAVVNLEGSGEARLERWRKIALNASEQSHRNTLPAIYQITSLKPVLAEAEGYQLKLVATLAGEKKNINQVLTGLTPASIFVLIGPEGDFTPEEIQETIEAGFIPVSLGNAVLRVETAAIAVASYIKLALIG